MYSRRFLPSNLQRFGKKPYGKIVDIFPSGDVKILSQFGKILTCKFPNLHYQDRLYPRSRKLIVKKVYPHIGDFGTYSYHFGERFFYPVPWEHLNY